MSVDVLFTSVSLKSVFDGRAVFEFEQEFQLSTLIFRLLHTCFRLLHTLDIFRVLYCRHM